MFMHLIVLLVHLHRVLVVSQTNWIRLEITFRFLSLPSCLGVIDLPLQTLYICEWPVFVEELYKQSCLRNMLSSSDNILQILCVLFSINTL